MTQATEFAPGRIIGRALNDDLIRCTAAVYDPATDRTTVTGETTPAAAPPGTRLRYQGQRNDADE
jgi:hypothetical protein